MRSHERCGAELCSAGAVWRACRALITFMLVASPVALHPAQDGASVVSPDRIEDVTSIRADVDAYLTMDNFAWRAFIALNWPSLTDAAHRGVPDRAKTLDAPGPRVWETFKARYEVFQNGPDGKPIESQPWATYDAANPCDTDASAPDVDRHAKTLASFDPFMDFNETGAKPGVPFNPLVAQNRTYTRFETRVNEAEYAALALSGWSEGKNLPDFEHPAQMPVGSVAVKAAWRPLTSADTPAIRARYYVVENANIVDVAKTRAAGRVVCSKSDMALVGLHIVVRTADRHQGLWSSFEQVDNVPPAGTDDDTREPDAKNAHVPYSYFDASKPKLGLWPEIGSPDLRPVSMSNPPEINPTPMQVVRRHPIHFTAMEMNRKYWALPGIKGTVWEHYMLVAAQWPTFSTPISPINDGNFFPERRPGNYVNTTMETYLQDQPTSCMGCHQAFNKLGHDFVANLASFR